MTLFALPDMLSVQHFTANDRMPGMHGKSVDHDNGDLNSTSPKRLNKGYGVFATKRHDGNLIEASQHVGFATVVGFENQRHSFFRNPVNVNSSVEVAPNDFCRSRHGEKQGDQKPHGVILAGVCGEVAAVRGRQND